MGGKSNKKGGKKHKRGKKQKFEESRELQFKEDGQEYAQITKKLGNGRFRLQCFDGKERMGVIRGAMRRRVWVNEGDIILVGLRDFQDDKADIILKYTDSEARNLKTYNELPNTAKIGDYGNGGFADDGVERDECAFDFSSI